MKNGPTTRANSFLIEMIIVLLFFSISISVTLGLFVEAHNNSISSREKNHAMILAQNVVEQVHSGDTSLNFIEGANITKSVVPLCMTTSGKSPLPPTTQWKLPLWTRV